MKHTEYMQLYQQKKHLLTVSKDTARRFVRDVRVDYIFDQRCVRWMIITIILGILGIALLFFNVFIGIVFLVGALYNFLCSDKVRSKSVVEATYLNEEFFHAFTSQGLLLIVDLDAKSLVPFPYDEEAHLSYKELNGL